MAKAPRTPAPRAATRPRAPRLGGSAPTLPAEAELDRLLQQIQPGIRAGVEKVFGRTRLQRLFGEFGLTPPQVARLAHVPRLVKQELTQLARSNDVREVLEKLADLLVQARKHVDAWERMKRPDYGAEALGHLNRAHQLLAAAAPDDGTWPEQIVGSEIIKLAAVIAEHALQLAPAKGEQRRGHGDVAVPASARAIEWIDEALKEPEDEASIAAAEKLTVGRTSRAHGGFGNLAALVFETAMGNETNPSRSITAYQQAQKAAAARRAAALIKPGRL